MSNNSQALETVEVLEVFEVASAPAVSGQALRPIADIIADLSKPLPARLIRQRQVRDTKGGKTVAIHYIEWRTAIRALDYYAPGWSSQVRSVTEIGGRCVVTVRLSIPCAEGLVSREATGSEETDVTGYGDPVSNAEAMALKRAASRFGLGLWLYDHN
jgi:hypothetical protein